MRLSAVALTAALAAAAPAAASADVLAVVNLVEGVASHTYALSFSVRVPDFAACANAAMSQSLANRGNRVQALCLDPQTGRALRSYECGPNMAGSVWSCRRTYPTRALKPRAIEWARPDAEAADDPAASALGVDQGGDGAR